jgi:hypothetical protein
MNNGPNPIQLFREHPIVVLLALCAAVGSASLGLAMYLLVMPRDFEIARLERQLSEAAAQTHLTSGAPGSSTPEVEELRRDRARLDTLLSERQRSIDELAHEVSIHKEKLAASEMEPPKEIAQLRRDLDNSRALLAESQRQVENLNRKLSTLQETAVTTKAELSPNASPSLRPTSYPSQDTKWFTASITKLIARAGGDVVVFVEYLSKSAEDYHVGLSGCATDWQTKTYVVDDLGNVFVTRTASGIGYVGCGWINDPVLLPAGGRATFSLVFAKPRNVDRLGTKYSFSSAQHLGRIGADGQWRNLADVNVSLHDLNPSQ